MRVVVVSIAITFALLSSVSASQRGAAPAPAASPHRALLDQYCVTCHNQRAKTAGLMLDAMDLSQVAKNGEVWEKAIRKLRGNLMPPPGSRQPDRAAVDSFVSFLENTLDKAAASPNPGSVALHRMNRVEYANAIKELLAIDIDAAALLPTDDVSDGFDNIANVLKVSPSFLDQYINAARAVTRQAIGDPPSVGPLRAAVRGGTIDSDPYVGGAIPLGTQASVVAEHLFPADGDYEIRANGNGVLTVDGVKVPATGRIALKAGVHRVGVATPVRSYAESDNYDRLQSFVPGAGGGFGGGGRGGGGAAAAIQVTGPYFPSTPVLDTESRRRIFICHPINEAQEVSCATEILTNIARLAFRRPATERDLDAPLAFFRDGRTIGNFESGIQLGLMAILASPKFLYRAEVVPANVAAGATYKLPDLDLASRLSFFLWSQIPDGKLLDVATARKLSDPATLEQQIRRMLSDPRSKSLVTNFAFQWLKVRETDKVEPDAVLFPNFDQGLRQAFRREIEMFLDSVIREDHSVLDLLSANYTFVNERLAAHYGVPDIRGNLFRRITLSDPNRWGLLGKGSILMVTSYPNRTAPVLRGAFILENLMGTPPAAPPPDVEGFKENKEGEKAKTVREIMEQHRSKPSCNGCHGVMDPLGFALENYDAIGAWRAKDRFAGTLIDASGKLAEGTPVASPSDLRKALMKRPEQFVQTITERLMTYALGRTIEYYDMPSVRKIVRDAAKDNYRFSSIVLGIVKSTPFQMRQAPSYMTKGN